MRRLLLLLPVAMILALPSTAQDFAWQFDSLFPPDTSNAVGLHGVAVDPNGKVWVQLHNTATVEINGSPAFALHIFNPDGTEADLSPIAIIEYEAGTGLPADTIGTRLGRGLNSDHEGHILASYGAELFRINYQTGEGMARFDLGTPPAAASADDDGNIYIGTVLTGHPIRVLDSELNHLTNVRDETVSIARSHIVNPDGLTFYETHVSRPYTVIHQRPDEFSAWDSTGVAFLGMAVETAAFHPVTGNIWVSSGNTSDGVNHHPDVDTFWRSNTWYEFDPDDLTAPLDSISWDTCSFPEGHGFCAQPDIAFGNEARPRGTAFSPDGNTLYLASFNAAYNDPGGILQKWTYSPVSNEPWAYQGSVTLFQNYPNPFAGSTTIEFEIEQPGHVTLRVFDVLGRQVAVLVDDALSADSHVVRLDAGLLATGTYLYTLEVDGQRFTSRRMLVVR